MLDEYSMLRHEREEEKRRMRVTISTTHSFPTVDGDKHQTSNLLCTGQDQKKFHEQLNTEQESMFGSRPSPARPVGPKKAAGPRANGTPNRRLSLNPHQNGSNGARSVSRDGRRDSNSRPAAPVNYVAIAKEDAASHVSSTDPAPASP